MKSSESSSDPLTAAQATRLALRLQASSALDIDVVRSVLQDLSPIDIATLETFSGMVRERWRVKAKTNHHAYSV